jgi:hypothetical protein
VEGTSQAVLDSFDEWKVPASQPASLSLFLKSENIPALLYLRKGPEYRPSAIFNLFPRHTRLGTDLKLQKGLYSAPSPIHNAPFFVFFLYELGISKIIINQSRSFCMVKPSIMGFLYPLAWAGFC